MEEEARSEITEIEALEILKRHESDTLPKGFEIHDSILPIEPGQLVSVTHLDDIGKFPAVGRLIRSIIDETVISHKSDEHQTTSIIHFSTIGFIVIPTKPQVN